ncbi:MAG: hypothetical protein ABL934_15930, partial [Lysobacteraceae bacterium]
GDATRHDPCPCIFLSLSSKPGHMAREWMCWSSPAHQQKTRVSPSDLQPYLPACAASLSIANRKKISHTDGSEAHSMNSAARSPCFEWAGIAMPQENKTTRFPCGTRISTGLRQNGFASRINNPAENHGVLNSKSQETTPQAAEIWPEEI